MLFERDPERYRRARPAYPGQLWRMLAEIGVAQEGARVLDIGAGTGQATGPLVQRGASVEAIEPGPALASRLRQDLPGVRVQVSTAEDATYPTGVYDGVVCATALHWVDLAVVLPRIRDCLRPGGSFVPFWHVFFDPEAPPTPFRAVIDKMFGSPPATTGTPLDREHWSRALTRDGLFRLEAVHTWRGSHQLSTRHMADLLSTFNGWTQDDIATATKAVDRLGGTVTEHYTTIAYVCRADSSPDIFPSRPWLWAQMTRGRPTRVSAGRTPSRALGGR